MTLIPPPYPLQLITYEQLQAIVPGLPANADVFVPYLNDTMRRYEINTPNRIACFIAQLAHESMGFRRTQEIASGSAYEGRADLGNLYAGDGKRYKGRGLIQCTGRINYMECSIALFGKPDVLIGNPTLLETPQYACLSAGWFWDKKGLNKYADLPDTWRSKTKKYTPFQYITYLVNGGQIGITERQLLYDKARNVWHL